MAFSIQFDSIELNNSTYNPKIVIYNQTPDKKISMIDLAQRDGVSVLSDLWGKKVIEIQGVLKASSPSTLHTAIDTANELFSRKDKNLDITPTGGTARRYVVRLLEPIHYVRDFYHLNFAPYVVRFLVAQGVGKNTSETHIVDTDDIIAVRSPAADSSSVTFLGSAEPLPRIVFTIDTLGQLSIIGLTNDTNGETIKIDGPFLVNDIVEINGDTRRVTKNATVVPFRGEIVSWIIGSNNYHIDLYGANYTLDQQQTTADTSEQVGTVGAVKRSLAQSFIPSESGYLKQIKLYGKKIGAPGNLIVQIYNDGGGKPGTNISGDGIIIAPGDVPTHPSVGEFTGTDASAVGSIAFLTAGETYWIVMTTTDSDGNYYLIYGNGASDDYTSGFCMKNDTIDASGTWVDYTGTINDLYFKTYYGLGAAADWNVDFDIYYTVRYL